jgi:Transmembrane secretion effector
MDHVPIGAPAPLRLRNFRLLFAARTISFFGTNIAPIAVAFAVLGLSNSATDVGLAFAAWTLAQISTLLVGGVVADRLPRRLPPGAPPASERADGIARYAAFLPAGYALAGPVSRAIGVSTTLRVGAAWIIVTTALVLCVREVRDFRVRPQAEAAPATQA